jgi:ABC-type Fe3+-siderophore transport system permease subunit
MKESALYLFIPMLYGSILGASLYTLLFGKGVTARVLFVGALAGAFLGSFGGMIIALGFRKNEQWPLNYWISTISATAFSVGLLRFMQKSSEE